MVGPGINVKQKIVVTLALVMVKEDVLFPIIIQFVIAM
jgi:hypothetical protein